MEMKNPVHPGQLVKDGLEDLGLSVAEGAKGLGITRQELRNIVSTKASWEDRVSIEAGDNQGTRP